MKRHTLLSVVVLCCATLLLTACVKTNSTQVNTATDEAVSAIQVFYSSPDRPYDELGLVTTQTGQTIFHDRSTTGMIRKLQEEALKLGADAIIVRSANEGTWGLKGGGNTGFDRGNAQAQQHRLTGRCLEGEVIYVGLWI